LIVNSLGHSFGVISHATRQVYAYGDRAYVEMLVKDHVKRFKYFIGAEDHNYLFDAAKCNVLTTPAFTDAQLSLCGFSEQISKYLFKSSNCHFKAKASRDVLFLFAEVMLAARHPRLLTAL
jgi:hypothetical protein